jgi:asparagine synthetase B (glutamine-hydrolysing)
MNETPDLIRFTLDGEHVEPTADVLAKTKVGLSSIPAMLFRGFGNILDQLPFVGLSTVPPTTLTGASPGPDRLGPDDLGDPSTELDRSKAPALADATLELLKHSIRGTLSTSGSRHVGVCLSGGLDSSLILVAAAEMKRTGELTEVSAFHYDWSAVVECEGERACAAELCRRLDVDYYVLDQSRLSLDDMLRIYDRLPSPYPQTFHVQLLDATRLADRVGVDELLTGVGAELHFAEPSSASAIQRAAHHEGARDWLLSPELDPGNMSDWVTERASDARDRGWRRTVRTSDPRYASRLARLYSYHELHTCVALEFLLHSCETNRPALHHPYLDPRFTVFASAIPHQLHWLRCGGEVYNKALLRIALRNSAPPSVSLRSSGAPYEAVEQRYLRRSWDDVVEFWNEPCILEQLGMMNAQRMRATLNNRRDFLRRSTYNLPVMLVESWLRANPDRIEIDM